MVTARWNVSDLKPRDRRHIGTYEEMARQTTFETKRWDVRQYKQKSKLNKTAKVFYDNSFTSAAHFQAKNTKSCKKYDPKRYSITRGGEIDNIQV